MRKLNFLFTAWEGGGNITPVLEAVRRLAKRGHRVRFMSDACNRPEAEAAGAEFVAWKTAPNRQDRTRDSQDCRDWAAATPQEGLMHVVRDIWCGPAKKYAQDVLQELRREGADLVVNSEMLFGVMAACESIGQKFAILTANVRLAPLPGIPPLGPGFAPAKTDEERAMHAEIAKGAEGMFDSGLQVINALRSELGLRPLGHLVEQYEAAEVELLGTAKAFDFECTALPEKVRYVGPLIADPSWAAKWENPWAAGDGRLLVTVGFSTTFQNHVGVVQKVIDALAPLPVRVLVTLGGSIEPGELRGAENCVMVASAPHTVVMKESALVVTHGGHGTVMRAIVNRRPMLVIPHGRDQNDNAVRVTERGAGLSLMPGASVEEIRAACERLLKEPGFAKGAKRLGDAVAREAERGTVVEELEGAARVAACVAA